MTITGTSWPTCTTTEFASIDAARVNNISERVEFFRPEMRRVSAATKAIRYHRRQFDTIVNFIGAREILIVPPAEILPASPDLHRPPASHTGIID